MMTFIPIAASVISFIEVPQRNEVWSWNATVWRISLLCRREGLCAVARFFLIYALSLRLPCSMNKIKKKKKKRTPANALSWFSSLLSGSAHDFFFFIFFILFIPHASLRLMA